jgi:hypothetical protein
VLRDRLAELWTLTTLAEEVHLSRSQLVRAFDARGRQPDGVPTTDATSADGAPADLDRPVDQRAGTGARPRPPGLTPARLERSAVMSATPPAPAPEKCPRPAAAHSRWRALRARTPPGRRRPRRWRSPASRPARSPAAPPTALGCAPAPRRSSSATSPPLLPRSPARPRPDSPPPDPRPEDAGFLETAEAEPVAQAVAGAIGEGIPGTAGAIVGAAAGVFLETEQVASDLAC